MHSRARRRKTILRPHRIRPVWRSETEANYVVLAPKGVSEADTDAGRSDLTKAIVEALVISIQNLVEFELREQEGHATVVRVVAFEHHLSKDDHARINEAVSRFGWHVPCPTPPASDEPPKY